jgi:hypothetical protein
MVAQEKVDRPTEVIAWSMLARCALAARDVQEAREALRRASDVLDPLHLDAHGRYRQALVRLAIEDSDRDTARTETRAYMAWAETHGRGVEVVDGALLLARQCDAAERVEWLERALVLGREFGETRGLGAVCTELGAALDQRDRPGAALEAYQQGLVWHRKHADADGQRTVVAATWAVGASACRNLAWPLARESLERALDMAKKQPDCADLAAWIHADLARAYEAAGDVVGARHQVVAALDLAREQELAALWPERFEGLRQQASALGLN